MPYQIKGDLPQILASAWWETCQQRNLRQNLEWRTEWTSEILHQKVLEKGEKEVVNNADIIELELELSHFPGVNMIVEQVNFKTGALR
jgi:hypothetical protein